MITQTLLANESVNISHGSTQCFETTVPCPPITCCYIVRISQNLQKVSECMNRENLKHCTLRNHLIVHQKWVIFISRCRKGIGKRDWLDDI